MAQKYRKVDPRIWTDEKFRQLDKDGKLLAVWLLTGTRVNRCGIVQWSAGLASEETGIEPKDIDTVYDTVCDTLNWHQIKLTRTVFLTRWWRYNKPDNESALKGALSDLHDIPVTGLQKSLVDAAQDLPSEMHTVYLGAISSWGGVSCTVSPVCRHQEQEQEQEQKQEQKKPPIVPKGGRKENGYCPQFDLFWNVYPRQEGKAKAYEAWKKAGKAIKAERLLTATQAAAWLMERVTAYAASPRATGSDPSKIPLPTTWLNQARYLDSAKAWGIMLTDQRQPEPQHSPQSTLPYLDEVDQ